MLGGQGACPGSLSTLAANQARHPDLASTVGFRMNHTYSFILHPPNKCSSMCTEHTHSKAPRGGGKGSGWGVLVPGPPLVAGTGPGVLSPWSLKI